VRSFIIIYFSQILLACLGREGSAVEELSVCICVMLHGVLRYVHSRKVGLSCPFSLNFPYFKI
jgi:hypothetical protein